MAANDIFEPLLASYFDAYARKDAAGCAAVYAEDAVLYSPFGPPARGRAAIEATHRDWFEEPEENKTWGIDYANASGDVGQCLLWFQSDIAGETARGVSLSALEHDPDGGWLIRVMSLNILEEENTT